jgi:uncharacterized membrane protein
MLIFKHASLIFRGFMSKEEQRSARFASPNTRQSGILELLMETKWVREAAPTLLALSMSVLTSMSVFGKWFNGQEGSSFSYLFNYALVLSNFLTVTLSVILMNIFSGLGRKNANPTVEYNQAEKQVIELLKGAGGSLPQSEIQRLTCFSKSKTSMVLSGLERRGLVKKARSGRSQLIRYVGD